MGERAAAVSALPARPPAVRRACLGVGGAARAGSVQVAPARDFHSRSRHRRRLCLCLAAGAIAGAWLPDRSTRASLIPRTASPARSPAGSSRSSSTKWRAAITGSTGAIWVGPLALGIAVGRWGCLFAGLADETYGVPTSLALGRRSRRRHRRATRSSSTRAWRCSPSSPSIWSRSPGARPGPAIGAFYLFILVLRGAALRLGVPQALSAPARAARRLPASRPRDDRSMP